MFKRVIDVVASLATIAAALAILWVLFTDAGATRAWPWQKQRPLDKPATGYVRGGLAGSSGRHCSRYLRSDPSVGPLPVL